jgi:hypothetical protein
MENPKSVATVSRSLKGQTWIYTAYLIDGTSEIIRRSSRPAPYDLAHLYADGGCGNGVGLNRFFTFGKRPSSYRSPLLQTFDIWEE